ncbi:hypothetical protein HZS_3329, partial [Henneguya salminicola]
MAERNLTAYPDNKFPGVSDRLRKSKYPPPTQKGVDQVVSSFTALDVVSLAGEMYEDSGLLMKGNVLHDLYDPSFVNPQAEMLFETQNNDDIKEFDYKSFSYDEKKLLLERLMEAEEKGFSPLKSIENTPNPEPPQNSVANTPKKKPKHKEDRRRRRRSSSSPHRKKRHRST